MLSLLKSYFVLVLVLVVASCGFKPLYKKAEGENAHSCTNFTVAKMKAFRVPGQKMQYELQDALNQACINQDKNYRVEVDLSKTKGALAIQKNRAITRYNLTIVGNYRVYEDAAEKPSYQGTSTMVGGFDAVTSDYGTYALEEDTQVKLMDEMANDMALRISSQILRKK